MHSRTVVLGVLGIWCFTHGSICNAQDPANSATVISPPSLIQIESVDNTEPAFQAIPEPSPSVVPTSTFTPPERHVILCQSLLPQYLSANTPPLDLTEVNLGLILSEDPGLLLSMAWGALPETQFGAKVMAQGASSTVGLNVKTTFLSEFTDSIKPALAGLMQVLFVNERTLTEPQINIFRGTRFQAGVGISKNMGALVRGLQADESLQRIFQTLALHAQAWIEYQNGREGETEIDRQRFNAGARGQLDIYIIPGEIFLYGVYDTIPDWIDTVNYYGGLRYVSQPELAFDIICGRLENATSLLAILSWSF
jgi:hypothetical protein